MKVLPFLLLCFLAIGTITDSYSQKSNNGTQLEPDDNTMPGESPINPPTPPPPPPPPYGCTGPQCPKLSFNQSTHELKIENVKSKQTQNVHQYTLSQQNYILDIIGLNTATIKSVQISHSEIQDNISLTDYNLPFGLYLLRVRDGKYMYASKKIAYK